METALYRSIVAVMESQPVQIGVPAEFLVKPNP